MIVDASMAVKWFVNEPESPEARRVLATAATLASPDLLMVEVASVLTRKCRQGMLGAPDVRDSMRDLAAISIAWTPSRDLLGAALTLSLAEGHPCPDCLYLALAQRTGVPLATYDRALAALAARLGVPLWKP